MKSKRKMILVCLTVLLMSVFSSFSNGYVNAEESDFDTHLGVSPMNESVILNPGDVYRGSFNVNNPGYSEKEISYYTSIGPFYVDENYNPLYENVDKKSDIAEWITITSGATGTLKPNDVTKVEFQINIPETAPAGGQYAEISVTVDLSSDEGKEGINIGESMSIGHVILVEITGDSISSGEILNAGVNSFLLGGNITAYSTVENTGNVHGQAIYRLKVYPLFSDTPIYSNEGEEEKQYILPGRKYSGESVWLDTPMVGIFNVEYTVQFMGSESVVKGMVIVCPWWLLILIIMGLILMILRIITLVKLQRMHKHQKDLNI
ncbi:hypothetical protein IKD82_02335 [Candidatus Saccharibacteria bacterium]|nr:hypothetical protein [Candidatus Saccharibacteria bacterium]